MRHQVLRNSRAGSEPLVSFLLCSDSKGTRSVWFGLFPLSEVGSVSLTARPGSYLGASGEDVLHVLDFPLYPAFRHFISQLVPGAWECSSLFSPGWPTRGVGNYGTGWMTRGPAPGTGLFSLLPAHKHTKSSIGRSCGINVNVKRLFKGCHQVFQPKKGCFAVNSP